MSRRPDAWCGARNSVGHLARGVEFGAAPRLATITCEECLRALYRHFATVADVARLRMLDLARAAAATPTTRGGCNADDD